VPAPILVAACSCGRVALEANGAPIVTAACYCKDCQAAGRVIEALPHAPRVLDPDSGTSFVVYRKDRLRWTKGEELLKSYKLKDASPTKRVVATCCNTAMVLGFDDAKHWTNVFRTRVVGEAPKLELRVCTQFKPGGAAFADAVPSYPGYPFRFIAKLLRARVAMLFG
jgi:hypothetical protein